MTMNVGDTYNEIHVTVEPPTADDQTVRWTSGDSTIVEVDPVTGYVTAKAPGTTTIYAAARDGSNVIASCPITVRTPVPLTAITVSPACKTLAPGETTSLAAIMTPENAVYRDIFWESDDEWVASVDENGGITAHEDGTAIITATSKEDSEIYGICTITVDSRPKVTVEYESDKKYTRIIFSNGKIWNCINFNIINNKNVPDKELQRSYENVYQDKEVNTADGLVYYFNPKTYTNEEIKLLYTLDPYGFAAYVKEYAILLFKTGNSVQDRLQKMLDYKDNIFHLLFERYPKYYKRNISGTWYETTDKSDLTKVLSESEFLFGQHTIYDIVTLKAFISVAIDIFSMVIQCPALKSAKILSKIEKLSNYYSLICSVSESVLNRDFNGFVSAIADGIVDEEKIDEDFIIPSDYKTKNYTLSWASKLLSFSSDLKVLADTFHSGPHFYTEVFNHCNDDLNYNIMIRTTDNKFLSLSDIRHVME